MKTKHALFREFSIISDTYLLYFNKFPRAPILDDNTLLIRLRTLTNDMTTVDVFTVHIVV